VGYSEWQRAPFESVRLRLPPLRPSETGETGAGVTDVRLSWTGAAALAATALFYVGLVHPLADTPFGEIFGERGRVPYAIAFFSWWAAIILAVKYRGLLRQRAALDHDLLPARVGETIAPETAGAFVEHLDGLPHGARRSLVGQRVRRALEHFALRADAREVETQLAARAQADADAVESSYTLVRVFIWAVPILGFIGTVIGIGASVGGFSESVGAAVDLAVMKNAIGEVTTGLAVAFDTTLLALVMSILIMFPASALQKAEEDLLAEVEEYCDVHLLPRLVDARREGRPPDRVIEESIARAMAAHHAELRGWLDRLGQIGETLTGQVVSGWEKIDEQLRVRQGEQQEHLSQWASARQREASDELAETQRSLLRDFRTHLEAMAAEARRIQEAGAHRQEEQLAGIERLHRRLQEEQTVAGEAYRAQSQEIAQAAENLARTLARVRSEAGEVRDEGARALADFAGQLRESAREAHAFQREQVAAQESQAVSLQRSGERLAEILGTLGERLDALERGWRDQQESAAARDAEQSRSREEALRADAALRESAREALSRDTAELAKTLAALREEARAARAGLDEGLSAVAPALAERVEALARDLTGPWSRQIAALDRASERLERVAVALETRADARPEAAPATRLGRLFRRG